MTLKIYKIDQFNNIDNYEHVDENYYMNKYIEKFILQINKYLINILDILISKEQNNLELIKKYYDELCCYNNNISFCREYI